MTSLAPGITADIEIPNPPEDSISSLAFSPNGRGPSAGNDFLAVGSWDASVRIYEVAPNGQAIGRALYKHDAPVLNVAWGPDLSRVFSGGADNAARMFDTATGQATQVGAHDAPVRSVRWAQVNGSGLLITSGWDKIVKYWDVRAPSGTPVGSVQLPERCYSMDVCTTGSRHFLVAATAERHVSMYDLVNPATPWKNLSSPLKWQTRVVRCFEPLPEAKSGTGFAIGSIEGRLGVHFAEDRETVNNYTFRCHRQEPTKNETKIFAVNDIVFHPVHGTFVTCGSDGTISVWDKDARTRQKTFDTAPGPISALSCSGSGRFLAYAVSYDWSRGHGGMTPGHPNKVLLHTCKDEEFKRRVRR
ncbi:Poly(A)+ RNA export protein [Coniophora puteana RWD-64-598 SS2]|uniref:Poly(A)+ RNA export protein n=1 Tax=Coniophora puteana (strain RWD-64-598) TaxID=741705 RepID=R7SGT4_CONPW|nr:Poly(A)+ RNA export protein [Coniophora puteana RWD-64-598 SS2]EIW74254.1 Poly(A)+ RNA export protein [Coniophora puteana RWD-64-598 SS2]